MSASREKRRRKELTPVNTPEQTKEKKTQEKKDKAFSLVAKILAVVIVVALVFLLVFNSGILQRTVKAVSVGDHKVTVTELNYYYNTTYKSAVSNMGDYAVYYGLDTSKDLHDQTSYFDEEQSWADYFYESGLDSLQSDIVLSDLARAEGLTLDEDFQSVYDQTVESAQQYASQNGMGFEQYLKAMYGKGLTVDHFKELVMRACLASQYQNDLVNAMEYTPEDLEAYYEEDPTVFDSYTYRSFFINGYTSDEEVKEATLAESQEKAEEMAARLEKVSDFEERRELFIELCPEYAAEEYRENYELDPDFTLSRFKSAATLDEYLSDFITDEARQPGDIQVIDGTTGYYVVMYESCGRNEYQAVTFRQIFVSPNSDKTLGWTDEEWDSARITIEDLYDLCQEPGFTVDTFTEYAATYSQDSQTSSTGGLYESALPGSMDTNVMQWLYGEDHAEGDMAVVKGTDGYYLVYFQSYDGVSWETTATSNLKQRDYENWFTEASTGYDVTEYSFGMKLSDY